MLLSKIFSAQADKKLSTADSSLPMDSMLDITDDQERKHRLLQTLCLIITIAPGLGLIVFGLVYWFSGEAVLLYLIGLGVVCCTLFLVAYWLTGGGKYWLSCLIVIAGCSSAILYLNWLLGPKEALAIAAIVPVLMGAVLLPTWSATAVGVFWTLFTLVFHMSYFVGFAYQPHLVLPPDLANFVDTVLLWVTMPVAVTLAIFPGKHLALTLHVQNRRLQQLLSGQIQDLNERKKSEEDLAAEKERLAVTLRSIGDGVITTDTAGRVELINPIAENLTGWTQTEAVGQLLPQVFQIVNSTTHEIAPNPVQRVLESGDIVGLQGRTALIAKDSTERYISNSGAPIRDHSGQIIGVVLVFRDISDRLRIEEEQQKTQKLESLGLLAGGIAHDFNNILTAIAGNIGLAKTEPDLQLEVNELLDEAETATLRAKDLTQQLLTFSRGGAPIKKITSLKDLLKESASFALRGSNVSCHFMIPDELWPVEADAGQLNQVINNLVINADQAMPAGGRITIEAKNIPAQHPAIALLPARTDYVQVEVRDQGIGIPPANLTRIFDPYFTTKQKGSGLGLAMSYSIINKHNGHISVASELGIGTDFTFYLPASPHKQTQPESVNGQMTRGTGRILLMDDDKMIRELGARALKRMGYEVALAKDGQEAIELYQQAYQQAQPYDIVIMDLTVPGGMGGKETIAQLIQLDPQVKAIVSSGYSNDPVMADYRTYHFQGVLTKPFRLDELSQKIETLIRH